MAVVSVRELLDAGVHFGHESRRWNPKMKRFIFEERNGIHIIDLHQTQEQVDRAYAFVRDTVASGRQVLFVGTKRQAADFIREAALKTGMPFVADRWLGGLLTNMRTVRKSIGRLRALQQVVEDGTVEKLPKKEVASIRREMAKLERNLAGIIGMDDVPGALFVIDPKRERIAVAEANRLRIPIVALVDTNCDPDEITHPIVSNDDAIRAIRLLTEAVARACAEGMRRHAGDEGAEEQAPPPVGQGAAPPEAPAESAGTAGAPGASE
ncbi:MAG: 30S ribosomal protein S2 [bacterium]|nr:30S ribosomal protein S2 [bacterium]